MLKACEFVVKIPTRFSINVGMAGAIVLYDRLISLGGYGARPVKAGGVGAELPPLHTWGAPLAKPGAIRALGRNRFASRVRVKKYSACQAEMGVLGPGA